MLMISTYPVFFYLKILFSGLSVPLETFRFPLYLKHVFLQNTTLLLKLEFVFCLSVETARKWTHEYLWSKKFQSWELLFTFKHHQMLSIPIRMNFPNSVFPGSSWPYSRSSFAYLSLVRLLWFLFWTWLSSQLTQILHNKITLFTTSSFSRGSRWSFFFLPSAPFL